MFNALLFLKQKKWYYQLTLSLISILSFSAVFLLPKTGFTKTITILVRYNNSRFLIIIAIFLFLAFAIKNARLSNLAVAAVIFPIFAFALNGLWASMYTETNVIAGILPRKDAFSFFTSAMSLIENGYLAGYSTGRRPLFGGLFAFLLWVFGENMQYALAAVAFFSAAATYFALIEVRKNFNPIAAVIFLIPQFLYYRLYIGNVMSETLGFILGMASLSFILMAIRRKKINLPHSVLIYLMGVFLFTLSQLTRPGAIITLPLMIFYTGWLFNGDKREFWKIVLISIVIVGLALLLNNFLLNQLTRQGANQFDNAFFGIYGVVKGGKSWGQIRDDLPDILALEPGKREVELAGVILRELIAHPENFIKGMIYQFELIFSLEPIYTYNIYSYMLSNNLLVDKVLIYSFCIFSLIGLAFSACKHKNPLYGFVFILAIGFFCSLPVSPAYQSEFMRYYPATIPLLGLLPAIGITWVLEPVFKKIKLSKLLQPMEGEELVPSQAVFSLLLASSILLAPFLIPRASSNTAGFSRVCPTGESEAVLAYYPGTEVSVTTYVKTWLPNISAEDFSPGLHNLPDPASIKSFQSIPLPATIFPTLNLMTEQPLYVVIDTWQIPSIKTVFSACGEIDMIGDVIRGDGIFYPSKMEEFQAIQ